MALRTPPASLTPPPRLAELTKDQAPQDAIAWQTYDIELVTPMYGGGVAAGKVDDTFPIRPTAIRGQLRFWWRFLAKHKYGMTPEQIRDEEALLWGGFYVEKEGKDRGKKKPKASLVFVQVRQPEKKDIKSHTAFDHAPYALFPARETKSKTSSPKPTVTLLAGNCHWQLKLGITSSVSQTTKEHIHEALTWWATFGGTGARTRRGLGAISIPSIPSVTIDEAQKSGCELRVSRETFKSTNAIPGKKNARSAAEAAWEYAVKKLQDFR